jgi:N-acetylmuramic acid 6-phosphate etherase
MTSILDLLELRPSDESLDFIRNKGQFHLFTLLTEQRHQNTWDLSFVVEADIAAGLRQILSVDDDLQRRIEELAAAPAVLEQMVTEFVAALIREGRRIYFYGCGATGRLAKQMESSFWRPFWKRLRSAVWPPSSPRRWRTGSPAR